MFYRTNNRWNCPSSPMQKADCDSIPRVVAEEAYKEYAAQYGTSQSFDRLHERGGFGSEELAILYERIKRLEELTRKDGGK